MRRHRRGRADRGHLAARRRDERARELYAATKRKLTDKAAGGDYTMAKNEVIDTIFDRIFAANVAVEAAG